ncbi:hypothetical protein GGQ21_001716 [Salinibacter ruber]|nr:hypothetical protein [Salinibacter ruber]
MTDRWSSWMEVIGMMRSARLGSFRVGVMKSCPFHTTVILAVLRVRASEMSGLICCRKRFVLSILSMTM